MFFSMLKKLGEITQSGFRKHENAFVRKDRDTDRRCNYANARNKGSPRVVLINAKLVLNIHVDGE